MKMKKLTLSHGHYNPRSRVTEADKLYRVERVTDSVEYAPGDMLNKDAVEALCNNAGWNITIQPIK